MMERVHIIVIAILAIAVWGCGAGHDSRLERADALACADPVKAIGILDSIDTAALSDADRAWYGLLRAKARSKNHETLTDLVGEIQKSAEYYTDHQDTLGVQSLFYYGIALCHNNQLDSSLLKLHQAYDLARNIDDTFFEAMAARELANTYRCLHILDKQLEYSRISKDLFIQSNRPVHAAWIDADIIHALTYTGKTDEALDLCNRIDTALYNSSASFRHEMMQNKTEIYSLLKRHSDLIALYDSLRNDGFVFRPGDWCLIAESYLDDGRLSDAIAARDSATRLPATEASALYLSLINARIHLALNDFQSAATEALNWGLDLLAAEEQEMARPSVLLLAEWLDLEAKNQQTRAANTRIVLILVTLSSILFIILLAAIIYILKMRHEKSKQKVMEQGAEISDLRLRLQAADRDARLLNDCIDERTEALSLLKADCEAMRENIVNLTTSAADTQDELIRRIESYVRIIDKQESEIGRYKEIAESVSLAIKEYNNEQFSGLFDILRLWHEYTVNPSDKKRPDEVLRKMDSFLIGFRDPARINRLLKIFDRFNDGKMAGFILRYPETDPKMMEIINLRYLRIPNFAIIHILGYRDAQAYYRSKSRLKKILIGKYGQEVEAFLRSIDF